MLYMCFHFNKGVHYICTFQRTGLQLAYYITTGATSGAGTVYPSAVLDFTPGF